MVPRLLSGWVSSNWLGIKPIFQLLPGLKKKVVIQEDYKASFNTFWSAAFGKTQDCASVSK